MRTNQHFEKLLDEQTQTIIGEMRNNKIRETVHQVQANVNSLKTMLNVQSLNPDANPDITMQLVVTALNPLQVSLEVARLRLRELDAEEIWEFCHLVGTSTLVAGYAYLGLEIPHLREDLGKAFHQRQLQMLNEAAVQIITNKNEVFPWQRVDELLSPEGGEELAQLYMQAFNDTDE